MTPLGPELLYRALGSERGIWVEVDDVDRARQQLYRFRREANDPALQHLALVPDPKVPNRLWIVKKAQNAS